MKLSEYTYICEGCGERIHIKNRASHDLRDFYWRSAREATRTRKEKLIAKLTSLLENL